MQRKLSQNQVGIVAFAPLLLIGAIFLLAITFRNSARELTNSNPQTEVLSESAEKHGEGVPANLTQASSPPPANIDKKREEGWKSKVEDNKDDKVEEKGVEEEVSEKEVKVEDEEEGVRLAKIKIKKKNGEFELESGGISVRSTFPLSVDSETNELTIKTPAGEKVVSVLPNQVVENMLANGFIDSSLRVEVQERGTEVEYEIEGIDEQRLLGLFKVTIQKRVRVSAQSGEVVGVNQSLFSRILDLISI